MQKVVSFCGIERGSFIYYIAALLSKNGATVLVIDNSATNDIFNAVSNEENLEYVVKQNITYLKNTKFEPSEKSAYDYVLIWQGLNIRQRELDRSEDIILLPDFTPYCLKKLNKITDKDKVTAVFMRDSVPSSKITVKYVADMLGIKLQKILGTIPYDSKDYQNYIAFLYNGRQTFASLTPDYNYCLKCVYRLITGQNKKDTEKLFNKAKKAKNF